MQNTLGDLNNHLFAEIERLSEEDLKGEDLKEEIKRADTIAKIGSNIIENANLVLRATSLMLIPRSVLSRVNLSGILTEHQVINKSLLLVETLKDTARKRKNNDRTD